MLIGQNKIKSLLSTYKDNNSLPTVISIIGRSGFGKTAVLNYLSALFDINDVRDVSTIDEIREIIKLAPTFSHNTIVHVANFESMNFRAKETLLKLCKDVPKYIYVVVEVSNTALYEDRFLNRSQVLELEPYTRDEIHEIFKLIKNDITPDEERLLFSMFGAPKDFELALNQSYMSLEELQSFIIKTVENITKASPYNAMKIFDKMSSKADDGKLDILLFLRAVTNMSFGRYMKTGNKEYLNLFNGTTKTLDSYLSCRKVNKKALFDMFIFNLEVA